MKREPNFPAMPRYPRQNSVSEAEVEAFKKKKGITELGEFSVKPRPVHRDYIPGVSPKPKKEKKEQEQAAKTPTYGPTAKKVYQHLLEHKEIRGSDAGLTGKQVSQAVSQLRKAGIQIETVRFKGEKIKGSYKVDYYKLQA